jgi:hypothetical protein
MYSEFGLSAHEVSDQGRELVNFSKFTQKGSPTLPDLLGTVGIQGNWTILQVSFEMNIERLSLSTNSADHFQGFLAFSLPGNF